MNFNANWGEQLTGPPIAPGTLKSRIKRSSSLSFVNFVSFVVKGSCYRFERRISTIFSAMDSGISGRDEISSTLASDSFCSEPK